VLHSVADVKTQLRIGSDGGLVTIRIIYPGYITNDEFEFRKAKDNKREFQIHFRKEEFGVKDVAANR
jgi:hypothetical protein